MKYGNDLIKEVDKNVHFEGKAKRIAFFKNIDALQTDQISSGGKFAKLERRPSVICLKPNGVERIACIVIGDTIYSPHYYKHTKGNEGKYTRLLDNLEKEAPKLRAQLEKEGILAPPPSIPTSQESIYPNRRRSNRTI